MTAALLALLRWRTLVVAIGLAAAAAVIWYLGPFVVLFGTAPLAAEGARTTAIVALVFAFVAVALFRYWRARRANARMISRLMESGELTSLTETQSDEEVALLRERFENAMAILRRRQVDTPQGRGFGGGFGRGFLLDLPWYVIIGPPGSGKTTILRNSGLDFPLATEVGTDVLAGVGGTRNCDWWFTDRAVLLDTAGRYTTQDSNAAVDRAAWTGFLQLLREFRRRRPLNGVLLALSLADVLGRDGADRAAQIAIFRQRLQELMRAFGLRLPVYLVITKCDLLPGFSEFFDDLTDEERTQLWGMVFTPEGADAGLGAAFNAGFADLLARVLDRLPKRLHEERDAGRRRMIFTFPQQLGAARDGVGAFVTEVFRGGRYEMAPMMRGVFLTSGTQEGTPIDRLMAAYSRAFGLTAGPAADGPVRARPFFVNHMLDEVVFAESGLVGTDRKLERRLAITHAAGYGGAAAVLAGLALLWIPAYRLGVAGASTLRTMGTRLEETRAGLAAPTLDTRLPLLDQARDMAQLYESHGFVDQWVNSLGMSGGATLDAAADGVYHRILLDQLLPEMAQRMRGQLADALARDTPNPVLHGMLATYLMLNQPARFDRAAVGAWMQGDAQVAFPLDVSRRQALERHYRALLDLLPVPVAIDAGLVDEVRRRLIRIPQAQAVYAQLRADAERRGRLQPFTFAGALGPVADVAFADPNATGIRAVIPGFFTRDGFYDGFVARLPLIVRNQVQSDWVLGQDDSAPSVAAAEDLIRGVSDLYVRDYIAAWQSATAHIGLTRWTSFDGLQTVLQALIGPSQPLARIVDAVRTNTDLPRRRDNAPPATSPAPGAAAAGGGAPAPAPASPLTAAVNTATSLEQAGVGLAFPGAWPGDEIRAPFAPISTLSQAAPGQSPPIGVITDQISAVYAVISQIASSDDPAAAALRYQSAQGRNQALDASTVLRNGAATRPEPLRSIMLQVANSVAGTIIGGARQRLDALYRNQVLPNCQAVVGNRYPFVRNARDEVTLKDFTDFFKPGGAIDAFAKGLEPPSPDLVGGTRLVPQLPPLLQAQLAAAARIKAAFFGNGADLLVRFGVTPVSLDPDLAAAMFQLDNTSVLYRHDPPRTINFTWPTAMDASVARITVRDFKTQATLFEEKGPWALFRLIDDVGLQPSDRGGTYLLTVERDGHRASFAITANSAVNAFQLADLRSFRCYDGR